MTALRDLAAVYRVTLRTALSLQLQYRGSVFIWVIGAVLEPLVYLVVWNAVAKAQGGSVNGFTPGDFAAYFIASLIVNQMTFAWVMWEYGEYIRDGTLAANLLRPLHPIHMDISENVTYKFVTLVAIVPAAALMIFFFRPTWHFQAWSLLAFVPALLFAFALRFVLEWMLAMSAFWTTRTTAVNQIYFTVFIFFSGQLAPLALMPAAVIALANLLPLRWTLAFPIELLLGQLTPRAALIGMGIQVAWLALALAGMRALWRAAVRRFAAVGG